MALIKSSEAMARLGYKDRGAFWDYVHKHAVPHIRLNARNIKFESAALDHFLSRRTIGFPQPGK